MRQIRSKLTSKAQITVPKEVRDELGVRPGDEIEWVHDRDGVHVRRVLDPRRFDKWIGYLKELEGVDVDALVDEMRGR